jgi:hypothetical protein
MPSHYIRPNDPHFSTTGINKSPITVALQNGNLLQSIMQACQLSRSQLPEQAREAHIIPGLTHSSLDSIGKLCDAGCEATFNKTEVQIIKDNKIILTEQRDLHSGQHPAFQERSSQCNVTKPTKRIKFHTYSISSCHRIQPSPVHLD